MGLITNKMRCMYQVNLTTTVFVRVHEKYTERGEAIISTGKQGNKPYKQTCVVQQVIKETRILYS